MGPDEGGKEHAGQSGTDQLPHTGERKEGDREDCNPRGRSGLCGEIGEQSGGGSRLHITLCHLRKKVTGQVKGHGDRDRGVQKVSDRAGAVGEYY